MSDQDDELREHLDLMNPDKVKRDSFLDIIGQIESSGGKNIDHPVIQNGIQKGDAALGRYGLMPNTVRELMVRRQVAGQQAPMPVDEDSTDMRSMINQNPQLEQDLANQLAQKVLTRQPNDEMAAYSWNQGHNLSPDQVESRDYQNSPYVQKFQAIKKSLGYK